MVQWEGSSWSQLVLSYSTSVATMVVSFTEPYSHQIKVDFSEIYYDFSVLCEPNEQERHFSSWDFWLLSMNYPKPYTCLSLWASILVFSLNMSLYHGLRILKWNTDHLITFSYEIRDTTWPPLLNPHAYWNIRMSRLLLSGRDTYQLQSQFWTFLQLL